MRRKRQTGDVTGCLGIVALLVLSNVFNLLNTVDWQLTLVCTLVGLGAFNLLRKNVHQWVQVKHFRTLTLDDVDNMAGREFEHYVAKLLEHQGYSTQVTAGPGDKGVDIIAQMGSVRYAVQCKRHRGNVSRTAVSDAVAGKLYYRCGEAMVVTNNYYTPDAKELAQSTGCVLVDRNGLAEWANGLHPAETGHGEKISYIVPAVLCCVILLSLCGALSGLARSRVSTASPTPVGVQALEPATQTREASPQIVVTIYAEVTMPPLPTAVTATQIPEGPSIVMAPGDTPVNVRDGPDAYFATVGMLSPGDSPLITGKSADGLWWRISYKGRSAWVSASVAPVRGDTAAVVTVSEPTRTRTP